MHKIVNLDDERNSVSITVEGKVFEIKRLVLKAKQLYGEYLVMSGEYLNGINEAQKAMESKDVEEMKRINAKLEKDIEDYAYKKADFIEKLLEVILTKNGYTYDREWWEENTDYQIMEKFIFTALKKDDPEKVDNKKKDDQQ
jgi:hypothetical protein